MFRSPDEQSMIDAAHARALAAYQTAAALARETAMLNPARMSSGRAPIVVGSYSPPAVPAVPGTPAAELVRMLDGQAQWLAGEAQRLRAELAEASAAPSAPRALAPAPRPVPPALALVELTRTPWLWLRWLLFPPITMLLGVLVGALSAKSPEGAAGALVAAVALVWVAGFSRGSQRVALLRRGEVPVVLQREEKVYLTRNNNVPMFHANGWDVRLDAYTGLSRGTNFTVQTTRAVIGKVTVSHGPAFNGVLLVDPDTARGCAHMDFASLPVPDERGQWRAHVPGRVWLGLAGGALISCALVGLAVALLLGFRIVR